MNFRVRTLTPNPLADVVGFVHMIPANQRTRIAECVNRDGVNMFFINSSLTRTLPDIYGHSANVTYY